MQIEAHDLEADICQHHGGPRDECSDPKKQWFPQRTVCFATMEANAANWRYDELHERSPYHDGTFGSWSSTRSMSHPYEYRDGVTIWTAPVDINPDDRFLGGSHKQTDEPAEG